MSSPAAHTTHNLFNTLAHYDILANLPFSRLTTFIQCACILKDDIFQPQPQSISDADVPNVLPPSITEFFADILNISSHAVDDLWDIICELVWSLPSLDEERAQDEALFRDYGGSKGLSE